MKYNNKVLFALFYNAFQLLLHLQFQKVQSTETQCYLDCKSPSSLRLVGPTRPWDKTDSMGNPLSLTKPYPYAYTPGIATIMKFNTTYRLNLPYYNVIQNIFGETQVDLMRLAFEQSLLEYHTFESMIVTAIYDDPIERVMDVLSFNSSTNATEENNNTIDENTSYYFVDLKFLTEIVVDHNGYNCTAAHKLYEDLLGPAISDQVELLESDIKELVEKNQFSNLYDLTLVLLDDDSSALHNNNETSYVGDSFSKTHTDFIHIYSRLETNIPNPYVDFCLLGCTFFFSDDFERTTTNTTNILWKEEEEEDSVSLEMCVDKCDLMYRYDFTVGYNDLLETARLECRDGCHIALKRCQPGYYCEQINIIENNVSLESSIAGRNNHTNSSTNETASDGNDKDQNNISHATLKNKTFTGGFMKPCPPGTYRDISYDAVTKCLKCPPGRFREASKGKNLESCSKCPRNTYNNNQFGSVSIKECIRCPAGQFTEEKGNGMCKCINPEACLGDRNSPADAEKRDTVPFIGRW